MVLAPPSPRSWDPGDIGSVTYLNENARDAFNFLLAPPAFQARQNAAQSIPNNALTAMTWDYVVTDLYGGHNDTTNPSRYSVPFAGMWLVYATVCFQPNATSRRVAEIYWNGSTVTQVELPANAAGGNTNCHVWWMFELQPPDYVEIYAYQSSGGALSTQNSSPNQSFFDVHYMGAHT